ncbi:hypothetical protein F5884DRAFT_518767 [Xylogone sp. PMI_703]|nr:hypothetical protein F5884DRAFT_518767 [Xylogone sp. PMI_703]
MAGRKRRFSTISIEEEVDKAPPVHYVHESSVLKSIAKVLDPDEWPCFLIEDAVVYWKDGETQANILDAELQGTYIVRGRLEVEKENRKYLQNKKVYSAYIEIRDSQAYSIGYGPTTIWASGKSGWFEIRPATEYQDIYNKIIEGIDLYYAILEAYEDLEREPKHKGYRNSLTVDEILLKYAIRDGTGLTRSEVIERIESHASFLLTHMRKEKLVKFEATSFYKWLKIRCPEIFQRLLQHSVSAAAMPVVVPPTVASPTPDSPSPEASSINSRSTPVAPDPQDISVTSIIVNFMLESDRSGTRTKYAMRFGPLSTSLFTTYRLPNRAAAQSIIRKRAREILDALDSSWETTPIYIELTEIAREELQSEDSKQDTEVQNLVKRERRGYNGMAKMSAGQQGLRNPKLSPQPQSSKSLPAPHSIRKTGGKIASLRLTSSPIHPSHLDTDDTSSDEDTTRVQKRQKRPRLTSEEDDSVSNLPNDRQTSTETPTSEDDDPSIKKEPGSLALTSFPLPSTDPTGPNGAWTCSEPDCNAIVRAAETPGGKREIQDHFLYHARRLAELSREVLVRKESVANNLPVSHLLEKLKALGREVPEPVATINGRVVPHRIKRETTA